MRLRTSLVLAAGAIIALAVWPLLSAAGRSGAAPLPTPAPIYKDYLARDKTIALEERLVRSDKRDQIFRRALASQYLQRFREQGDFGDIARAQNMAQQSIALQPQLNTGGQMGLASALLNYHDFRGALKAETIAYNGEQRSISLAQVASIDMELGRYPQAAKILAQPQKREDPSWDAVRVRYDELTGRMAQARALLATVIPIVDSGLYEPAYDRSWYHLRAAELAFESGDDAAAQKEFDESLRIFPDNYMALMWEARFYRAHKQWAATLDAANRSAQLYPLPQVLGYKADAQRALGDARGARATDGLIRAEQRLFNVQGVNDRLLANYYDQRHLYPKDALRAAEDDYQKRGDEIYADDTMAWTLAARGDWKKAEPFARRATRWGTQDSEVQYHAGIIAQHVGDASQAKQRLQYALQINPQFDAFDADDARAQLARLNGR